MTTCCDTAACVRYYEPCNTPGLVAHALRTKSQRWNDCMPNIKAAVNAQRAHNRGSDIPPAVTHYLSTSICALGPPSGARCSLARA
jgi:hypothetical protein